MKVWKISHSPKFFDEETHDRYIRNNEICMHPNTGQKANLSKTQGEFFTDCDRYGDVFYVCNGDSYIDLIGVFTEKASYPASDTEKDGWHVRKFIILFAVKAEERKRYTGKLKWWTPNDNGTFVEIPDGEYTLFEEQILNPHFGITFEELKNTYDKKLRELKREL